LPVKPNANEQKKDGVFRGIHSPDLPSIALMDMTTPGRPSGTGDRGEPWNKPAARS